jgi:hypothetical protein
VVTDDILGRLRETCLSLPTAYEEQAWVGTRWCVRKKTFAHVLTIENAWPPAYARAAATEGPLTVLTFRSSGQELDALANQGPPFFKPVWFPDIVGMALDDDTDWDEVDELLTESYCLLAPQKLTDQVERP